MRGATVLADYVCADEAGGSGIASCEGTVADGSAINTATLGAKSFTVTATDNAGNPATKTVFYTVVAGDPPQTTITSGPTGVFQPGLLDLRNLPGPVTNDSTPTFAFTSSAPGSTFECRVDAGSFGSCSSPFTTPFLADGQHTFYVRATDMAGNTDPTPDSRTFTVAPQCTLVGITIMLIGPPIEVCLFQARASSTRRARTAHGSSR